MYETFKDIYQKELGKREISQLDPQLIFLNHFLPQDSDITILDAGCGSGKYAFELCKKGYQNMYAIDLFEESFFKNTPFCYSKNSIENTYFQNETFDFIYSFSVIYYLQNIEDGIKEFKRILKKNGLLLLSAHTKYSLHTLERVLKQERLPHLQGVRFYSAGHYKKLLEQNGFEVLHVDGFNTSYFLYPWYRKFANSLKLNLPKVPTTVTKNRVLARIRAEISYHSLLVARKK